MRYVTLKEVQSGMVLGESITSPDGVFSLGMGTVLTPAWIDRMKKWGMERVKVKGGEEDEFSTANLDELCAAILETEENVKKKHLTKVSAESPVIRESLKRRRTNLPVEAFLSECAKAETELRRAFLGARCNGRIPLVELLRLVDQIIFPLLRMPGIFQLLHVQDRAENYLYRHAMDVALLAGMMGKWLRYQEDAIKVLMYTGLLHDIGKSRVAFELLSNPGDLTKEEREIAKTHVSYGHQMLLASRQVPEIVMTAVHQHHERADGSGYPKGLKGEAIHPFARVLGIADVYDAIVSDRFYRKGIQPLAAIEKMLHEMVGQFDLQYLNVFLENARQELLGARVTLTNGDRAEIVFFHGMPNMRPMLRMHDDLMVDLSKERDLQIQGLIVS